MLHACSATTLLSSTWLCQLTLTLPGLAWPGLAVQDEWDSSQVQALTAAYHSVDPTHPRFWQEVAAQVPGRTAAECFSRMFDRHKTPEEKSRVPRPKRLAAAAAPGSESSSSDDDGDLSAAILRAQGPAPGLGRKLTLAQTLRFSREQHRSATLGRLAEAGAGADHTQLPPELLEALDNKEHTDRYITSFLRQAGGWSKWQRTCRQAHTRRVGHKLDGVMTSSQSMGTSLGNAAGLTSAINTALHEVQELDMDIDDPEYNQDLWWGDDEVDNANFAPQMHGFPAGLAMLPGFPAGFPPGFPANLQAAAFALAAAANLKRAHPDGARAPVVEAKRPVNSIPQRDGPGDEEDEEEADEQAGGTQQEPEAADDEVLSSDSEPEEEEEGDVQNFLCCQYEKVTRTKNRWKVSVKEGVFHINASNASVDQGQVTTTIPRSVLYQVSAASSEHAGPRVQELAQLAVSNPVGLAAAAAGLGLATYGAVRAFDKGSRAYVAPGSVGQEYDAWTEEGVLEYYWGEHIHLGTYSEAERAAGYTKKDFKQAKYDFIDEMLAFSGASAPTSILDVGCGFGGTSRHLAKKFRNASVRGITLSPKQVQRGGELAKEQGVTNVRFEVMDALAMQIPDNTYDLVWACESGEHMPDKKKYVEEMVRVLKPGGTLVIACWCQREETPDRPFSSTERKELQFLYDEWAHPYFISYQEFERLMKGTGLMEGVVGEDWTPQTLPSWLHSIWVGVVDPWIVIFKGPAIWYKTVREIVTIVRMHNAFASGLMQYGLIRGQKRADGKLA
ncbi:hypothetical protein QJQ45_019589 [Haematococcus lacustris]|nr:hypothetical protein QJQ45_019589 [Haematococcus lacustris]